MYFGWCIVVVAALTYMLTVSMLYSAFGLFVIPVSEEFGLSRANMNSALILLNVGNAMLSPFMGRMLDRIPAKRIMIVSTFLLGGSLVGLGLSRSLWLSAFIICVPLALSMIGAGTLTMSVLLARWFTVQRGRAMMLAALGLSLGGIIATPVIGWLIERGGWRSTLFIMAATCTVILLLLATIVRERPGDGENEGGAASSAAATLMRQGDAAAVPLRPSAILRMRSFWLIALSSAITLGAVQSIAITMVPLALEEGLSMMQATSLVSVTGVSAITGKLLLSIVADKVERVLILSGLFALGAVLNAALLVSGGYATLLVCGVILGVASGAIAPLFYALVADRFGTTSFGTVRGMMAPILAVMGAIAVRFSGEVYDRTGGYDLLFTVFILTQLVAAALMYLTRKAPAVEPEPVVATIAAPARS